MIYIGTSGYNYYHWKDVFYPAELNSKDFFSYYQKYFNTVEINYSFYHFPKESTVEKWYKNSKEDFFYSLKVPKGITHLKKLKNCNQELTSFINVAKHLKEKLGVILFQLPPSFHFTEENLSRLKEILSLLPPDIRFAIEFRHKSWFTLESELDFLKGTNLTVVVVSAPKIPFKVYENSKLIYIRLHGKDRWYSYDYSEEELKEFANIITENKGKIKEFWIYFNNDFGGFAAKNAIRLKEMVD
jgi:uncharacterized protein YecE (DUF72 family)